MRFYSSGLNDLLRKIESGAISKILIHGSNQGFASTATEQIIKKMNLMVSTFTAKEITANKLRTIANNQNFFGQKELIKITGSSAALNKEMKEMLINEQFHNIICFTHTDALPPSGIRKFFEDQKDLASLGCYYDNENTIAKIILQQCAKHKKNIDEDALFYLKSHLKGDHQIIKSELNKLFCYTHDQGIITKDDILATLSRDLLASGDEMCIYFAKKEPKKFIHEVAKLKEQNKNEVLMIRALIRYYLNIYQVSLRVEDGENTDRATKTLYPPIFFKYVDDFKQILRKTSASDAINCLKHLQQAEINYKTNPKTFDMFELYVTAHI